MNLLALRRCSLFLLALLFVACSGAGTAASLVLEPFASGLKQPISIASANDGSGRFFVSQQHGQLVIVTRDGKVLDKPFLDLSSKVSCCGERGLLGVAFDPNYQSNGFFYVDYTNTDGNTVIARYQVSDDPNVAKPDSAKVLLTIQQPQANHNGGELQFGPDGYLYIGMGDGGGGGDQHGKIGNGQSLDTLLGKILRIDVEHGDPYAIPKDNPFVGREGAKPEIWAYGLRNPWRFSFDRKTGDLWIADVGQNKWEEIDFQKAGDAGGENYGWRLMEGTHCYNPSTNCNDGSLTLPILEYSHSEGCSVTGGYVYRGSAIPDIDGDYFYGDYCSGYVWQATQGSDGKWTSHKLFQTGFSITTWGQDAQGELYVADYNSGKLYKLVEKK